MPEKTIYLNYAIFNICDVSCNVGPLAVFKKTYACQKITLTKIPVKEFLFH